jgi:hypothetical protein
MPADHASPSNRPSPSGPTSTLRVPRRSRIVRPSTDLPAKYGRTISTVVLLDLSRSAGHDSQTQRNLRADLFELVRGVIEYTGLALKTFPLTDTGDGIRILVPVDCIQPFQVIDLFVYGLAARLRQHRRRVNFSARLRLRVAFDLGLVEPDVNGWWTGAPLIRVARLVDADAAREILYSDIAPDFVGIVSSEMYEAVIRHGYGYIAPDCFREVSVRIKEFHAHAWLLTPGAVDVCGQCRGIAA